MGTGGKLLGSPLTCGAEHPETHSCEPFSTLLGNGHTAVKDRIG